MRRQHGKVSRVVVGLIAAAAWIAVPAAAVLLTAPPAVADSFGAVLTLQGVQTSAAPNGTSTLNIATGDSLTFSVDFPTARGASCALSCWAIVNAPSFPRGNGTVLYNKKAGSTLTVMFPNAGQYGFSWSPRYGPYAGSSSGIKIPLRSGEYTSATINVIAPAPPPDTSIPTDPGQPTGTATTSPGATATGTGTTPGGTGSHPGAPQSSVVVTLPNGEIRTFPGGPGLGNPQVFPTGIQRGGTSAPTSAFPSTFLTGVPTSSGSSSPLANLVEPPSNGSNPPTGLAIIAIIAFAIVTSYYAYGFLQGRPIAIEPPPST